MTSAVTLLEVSSLAVSYGAVAAVRDVSLSVDAGEVVALLGANGAGKTTTLRAISGLVRPRHGHVLLDGDDVTGGSPERLARRGVAHVPAGRAIFGSLSVQDNLNMALYGAGADERDRLDDAFTRFPVLAQKRRQPAGELSGGQQQQLAIARAVVQRPRLMLIDEMSMGLAPSIVAELFELIDILRRDGIGVLVVEQFVTEALRVADRAVVLEQGVVVASGAAADLSSDDVAAAYLGAARSAVPTSSSPRRAAVQPVTARVPGHTVRNLERLAARRGVSVDVLVAEALEGLDPESAT